MVLWGIGFSVDSGARIFSTNVESCVWYSWSEYIYAEVNTLAAKYLHSKLNYYICRYEIFAKRLAQYAKSASNDTKVNVMTAIKAPGTVTTFTNGKYAWFAPKLLYQINSDANCDVVSCSRICHLAADTWQIFPLQKAEITYVFDTLERRIPTRLEIQLDELFENYCYGWSSTDQ